MPNTYTILYVSYISIKINANTIKTLKIHAEKGKYLRQKDSK